MIIKKYTVQADIIITDPSAHTDELEEKIRKQLGKALPKGYSWDRLRLIPDKFRVKGR